MTGRDFATLLGVHEATISKLTTGDRRPSLTLIVKIGRWLDWGVEEQALALAAETYPSQLKEKIDALPVSDGLPPLRCLP